MAKDKKKAPAGSSAVESNGLKREQAAAAIAEAWHAARQRVIDVGRLLLDAKASLPHGQFEAMIEQDLPFTPPTARKLMAIAQDGKLLKRAQGHDLPADWTTLYELTKLDEPVFDKALKAKEIHADMTRGDVGRIRLEAQRSHAQAEAKTFEGGTIVDLEQLIARGFKARCILADPPWKYETWSPKGGGRSPDRHYPTLTIPEICALPIRELVADDAVIFLWGVNWAIVKGDLAIITEEGDDWHTVEGGGAFPGITLPAAPIVMAAWGFDHVTKGFNWVKQRRKDEGGGLHQGTGKWTRANAEDCWIGTRGKAKPLANDVDELLLAPVMEHSRKPGEIHERIERLVRGPYLELFARREHPGWIAWGNEVETALPDDAGGGSAATKTQTRPAPKKAVDIVREAEGTAADDFVGGADPEKLEIPKGCRRPGADGEDLIASAPEHVRGKVKGAKA